MHARNLHNVRPHFVRGPAPSRFVAGVLVTLALLSAACSNSDPASRINAPSLLSMDKSQSAATSNFTVLANAAVTCTDGTIIGNVGTFQPAPTGSITQTICPISGGTPQVGTAASIAAFNNFLNTYAALAPKPGDCNATHTLPSTIPASETLSPGVYCTSAALTATDVTLTLDGGGHANATWLFKIGTGGTGALTGTNFSVVMAGSAQPCNVTWWVAQAATIKTNLAFPTTFQGNILAGAAITLTQETFNGNAWAGASGVGDVTTTGTTVTGCAISNGKGNGKGKDKDKDKDKEKCNQGVGNGSEGCDPGNSNNHNSSNDENGGTPGDPGRQGGHH
jgi:Ice-binding-like